MQGPLRIQIFDKQQLAYKDELVGSIELGRQRQKEQGIYRPVMESGRWRLSVAGTDEQEVSRRHAFIEPLSDNRVRITNLSEVLPIVFVAGDDLLPRSTPREISLPVTIVLGDRLVQIDPVVPESISTELKGLNARTVAPGKASAASIASISLGGGQTDKLDLEEVLTWVQTSVNVLQSAANSSDFFDKAAQAAVALVGLDSGQVLLFENENWIVISGFPPRGLAGEHSFSRRVVETVRREKRTFWQDGQSGPQGASLIAVKTLVAAPILDRQGEVIGVLYGDRNLESKSSSQPISRVEALLMELLATGVATGLARQEQEKAALTARVQFEQFFTPELAHHLTIEPDLLKGRDADVTLLFVDIRRFSRHCELLGAVRTDEWIGEVMDSLCEAVQANQGVLVDFRGDELFAMWGAPKHQPDHPRLACRSAIAMLQQVAELNKRWEKVLGEPMDVGIGVNSGPARVGNRGSNRKFKYGPHGNTVNLASRIQGATKYLKVRILITGATRKALDDSFSTRCLGRVRVVNIAEPVELHELATPTDRNKWTVLEQGYKQAMAEFESKEFRKVIRTLGNLLVDFSEDGPALVLLARAVNYLVQETGKVDTVWELPGK